MDWHLVLSSLTFAISVASLLVSRHAWTIAEEAFQSTHPVRGATAGMDFASQDTGTPTTP